MSMAVGAGCFGGHGLRCGLERSARRTLIPVSELSVIGILRRGRVFTFPRGASLLFFHTHFRITSHTASCERRNQTRHVIGQVFRTYPRSQTMASTANIH